MYILLSLIVVLLFPADGAAAFTNHHHPRRLERASSSTAAATVSISRCRGQSSPCSSITSLHSSLSGASPSSSGENSLSIEYCTGCRWMLRSAWMAQELLTTFQDDDLDSVTLVPSRPPSPGGIFTVRRNGIVVWDRKEEGGFPESKELKQRVRDLIVPEKRLGHSDRADDHSKVVTKEECEECDSSSHGVLVSSTDPHLAPSRNVAITYCTGCRWLLRSAWIMQELLSYSDLDLNSISLIPSRPPAEGGVFTVTLNDELLWDRVEEGGFPQPEQLKQKIQNGLKPSRNSGNTDVVKTDDDESAGGDLMDDEDAIEMRKYFGVL